MLDGNLSALTNFTKVSPYTKADTANAMPINQHRQVTEIQNSLSSKEYVQKQNIRELYLKGYITKEVYQKETRVVFEIASTLGV